MNAQQFTTEFNFQACTLLDQSLLKIIHCLEQINEGQCWWRPHKEANSIGNHLLHMNGNLRQWSIVALTNQADTRNRDEEFLAETSHTKNALLNLTQATVAESKAAISSIGGDILLDRLTIQGFDVSVMQAVLHTTTHFQGHVHQIILLTRLQLGDNYRFGWNPDCGSQSLPM